MDELRLQLMTTEGYMQYLGAEKSSLAALTLEEIVVDCHVSLQVGIAHIKDKCEKYFSVHVNFYSAYFNCYRYIPLPRNASDVRIVRKMSFILNVGNEHIATIFNPLAEQWHTAGAYFMVTDPREAKPAIGFDGVNIPTGMYSSLGISLLDKTSLPLPHGECIAKDEDEARAILGDCFFQSISETCGCLDVRSIMHFNLSYISSINKPFCLSMELDIETVRGNTRCSIDTSYQRGEACFNKMTERCNQKRYDKVISQAKWPAISNIPSFINFLATKPDSLRIGQVQLFNKYQQCFRNSKQNSDCDDISQKIKYEIDNSFAEVNVEINDYHYYTMADEPKVSWAELSSQIGGILNLWSGITAVLLLELVEFLYRIVHSTVTGKDADRDKPNAAENGNSVGEKTKETSVEMRPALKSTCAWKRSLLGTLIEYALCQWNMV